VTPCILVEIYVRMGAFPSILLSLCNVCTLLPYYTASRPRLPALLSPPLDLPHISHVLILTALYAWSTDVGSGLLTNTDFVYRSVATVFVTSTVLAQLLSCHCLFSNIQECRCTSKHLTHLIHKQRTVRVSVMMHLAAGTSGPKNALHVKRCTNAEP
jgi:hypothetical protein